MVGTTDSAGADSESKPFTITRLFDAPRSLVFASWTEEERLKHWFCPEGFTIPVSRLNLIPGGAFHYCMRAVNGVEMWGKWIFDEITPSDRLVFVNTFSNKHGNLTRHPYVVDWPLELETTVTLSGEADKTFLRMEWIPINPSAKEKQTFDSLHAAMTQGWNGTLNQLAAYLATL